MDSRTAPDITQELRVPLGHEARFALPETPSTGYLWEVAPPFADGVQLGSDFAQRDTHAIGAGGYHTYTARVAAPGTYTLHFGLRRPWEYHAPFVSTARVTLHYASAEKGAPDVTPAAIPSAVTR